jgi:hemerythrin-like domain-containing protein
MKATAVLMNEHKYILRALNILEQMALEVERGEAIDDTDTEYLLQFLRTFADGHHQGKEECVLFPAMLEGDRSDYPKLCQMIFEHDQERSLVEGLEDAVRTKKGKDFVYYARRLVNILRTHIYKEDHILFGLADAAFSAEEDERVARNLADYERSWQDTVLSGQLKRLNALEWRYLGKAASVPWSRRGAASA